MKNPWVKLNLALNSPLPSLYIKYDLTATSCRVILTDLAKLWSEDLSRAQILQRAIEIGTSIDPSEDREQLNVLLQKVQDALQNKEGTHLQLIAGDQDGVLQLKTLTQLPAPFQPLLWHFKLLPLEHVALTEELLLPLLQDHAGLSQDFRALISSLEEKDHVILKLLDKIEGSSVSLSDVFPSLRGGKKVLNRSVAESSISGLAGFDSKKFGWKSETARLLLERGDQRFSYMGDESASLHHAAADGNWWTQLSKSAEFDLDGSNGKLNSGSAEDTSQNQSQGRDDGAFQTQTPPPPKSRRGEEVGAEPQQALSAQKSAPSAKKKLGKIGGAKAASKKSEERASRSPERHHPRKSPSAAEEESPVTTPKASARTAPQNTPSPKTKRMGRLGTIGGRKKETTPSPEPKSHSPAVTASTAAPPSPTSKPKPKSRLGTIGGKHKKITEENEKEATPLPTLEDSAHQPTGGGAKEPSPTPNLQMQQKGAAKPRSPVPEETEEEKADKKRQELKRQLYAKAKAPVKKKRKF